jgi:hypothetical protein
LSPIESLISNFVGDVLRLLREARVEELLNLVAEAPRPIPPLEDSEPELLEDPTGDDGDDAEPLRSERAPVMRLAPVRRIARRPRLVPPAVEEITDPASLLAIAPEPSASAPPPPPPTLPTLLADPDDVEAPPPSSSQESRVLVRLNSNETLARSSNAGIVIRRRKA